MSVSTPILTTSPETWAIAALALAENGGQSVQLGPRPFYLVENMDKSDLKSALQACAGPASEIADQVKATRAQPGATGNLHFSMKPLMRNAGGVADARLTRGFSPRRPESSETRTSDGRLRRFSDVDRPIRMVAFSGMGDIRMSLDGGQTYQPIQPQIKNRTATASYFVPIPEGTRRINLEYGPQLDGWYNGPFAAKDFAIWARDPNAKATVTAPAPSQPYPAQAPAPRQDENRLPALCV